MGKVSVILKIMPESAETDLEKIKAEISSKMKINDAQLIPLAFGLQCLKILIVTADASPEQIEQTIRKIPGVADVEVESATLI